MIIEKLKKKSIKKHFFIFKGNSGYLEGIIQIPNRINKKKYIVIIGHPHPLKGGNMYNKIVTTIANSFNILGIPSATFNFRGVGKSEGKYDKGYGETKDMLSLTKLLQNRNKKFKLLFSGFSFGSYVAYKTALHFENTLLITIAPPINHYHFHYNKNIKKISWIIFQGNQDHIIPISTIKQFAQQFSPPIPIILFKKTGHFFHKKLIELKKELVKNIYLKLFYKVHKNK
ncbi:hypothetical protein [Candidatus Legionella polyplacis]|uniref:Serine hydrolase domain-containing protein n=1 Tax=Candidatus Legionella polyplacis TaxID=2005262 RepID=A0ABZ2H018_9GAMM